MNHWTGRSLTINIKDIDNKNFIYLGENMKSTTSLIGILLIIAGILLFAYEGFTYNKPEQIAQIGDVHVIENHEKTVYFPPIYGGIAILAGIVLIVVGRRK